MHEFTGDASTAWFSPCKGSRKIEDMPRRKQVQTKEIHAPTWDTHEVVIIRSLTGNENDWIQDRTSVIVPGESSMQMKLGTTQRLTLVRGIESWTFTDADNKPLLWPPLSLHEAQNTAICLIREQSLAHVFPEDRLFIYNEITALGQPMTEEEKKDSGINALNGSQDTHKLSQNQSLITS
jgi:hypothetical protein